MRDGERRMDNRLPLVIVTGPTAVGKTALSVRLAKKIGAEIISADSMQVYRGMDIGSAKVTKAEMDGVPHHLIDVLEPEENFNVASFQRMAKDAIRQICGRGRIPILTGGTGFYIQSVVNDIDFTVTQEDEGLRRSLEDMARAQGPEKMHALLAQVDEKAACQIHPHNVKRVIRALEYYQQTGQPISTHNERERKKTSAYRSAYFVLTDEREKIYAAIDRRVDAMIRAGLVEEVRSFRKRGLTRDFVSMQGLGYKEIFPYLDGEYDLDRAVYLIKRDTRHFAKRQLTWFAREKDVIWVNKSAYEDEDSILQFMIRKVEETIL